MKVKAGFDDDAWGGEAAAVATADRFRGLGADFFASVGRTAFVLRCGLDGVGMVRLDRP